MKKTFLSGLLLFVAAATFTSCAKDETSDLATTAQTTISATVEEPTRTILDGTSVKWMANDKILLANANGKTAEYTLTTGAGTTSGTFSGTNLGAGEKFALYPYSAAVTCDKGKVSFEMPATQAYAATTFGSGANPMIAQSDANGVMNFQNVCGVIKLTLKGTQKVGKIVVSTVTTAAKLSGKATVTLDVKGLPVLTMDTEAANAVTLECGSIPLNTTTATPFYIVVPAATYTSGMQFAIYDASGALVNSLINSKLLIVRRSQVSSLTEKTMAATVHFPDARFRTALVGAHGFTLTTDGTDINVDDEGNKAKFTSQKEINVSSYHISSLKGIEYFTGLNKLYCHRNQLTSLDLSQNTELTFLYCAYNQLNNLNVRQNIKLITVGCYNNQLKKLDVTPNIALSTLNCYNNHLSTLDISKTNISDGEFGNQTNATTGEAQNIDLYLNATQMTTDLGYPSVGNNANVKRRQK